MLPQPKIEMEAAQALFAARMLVAAIHDVGPWEFRWGSIVVPAEREFVDGGVRFKAVFPDICWIDRPSTGIEILCDGEVMGIRQVAHPGDTEFVVTWDLSTAQVAV